jgi:prophage regulatory protein
MLAKPDLSLHSLRIITKKELRLLVPYTPQHILRLENEGKFPKRVPIGTNRVGWRLVEVEEWLKKRIAERDGNGTSNPPAAPVVGKQP